MQEKQKQMIEEMRKRGIKPEDMEEIIKKYQQEMSEWEAAMEAERKRQAERLQKMMDARAAKHHEKMLARVSKIKEDNMKIIKEK